MSPIDQKTRPLKENHLIQRVLHRPVELARLLGNWPPLKSHIPRFPFIAVGGSSSSEPHHDFKANFGALLTPSSLLGGKILSGSRHRHVLVVQVRLPPSACGLPHTGVRVRLVKLSLA